jgi:hypothetical protein
VDVDVVGMAVAAVGVVTDDDVRAQLPDDRDERADGVTGIGVDEPLPITTRRRACHAGIAPPTCTAEERRLGHPQFG